MCIRIVLKSAKLSYGAVLAMDGFSEYFSEGGTIGATCGKNLPYFCRGLQNARAVAESATAAVHTYWVRAEVSSNIV